MARFISHSQVNDFDALNIDAELVVGDDWGNRTRSTKIVAIGTPGSVSPQILRTMFDKCLVSP
jgi:hypothetical protein